MAVKREGNTLEPMTRSKTHLHVQQQKQQQQQQQQKEAIKKAFAGADAKKQRRRRRKKEQKKSRHGAPAKNQRRPTFASHFRTRQTNKQTKRTNNNKKLITFVLCLSSRGKRSWRWNQGKQIWYQPREGKKNQQG